MKDRKDSPRRRAIVVLFKHGKFTPVQIARVLKMGTHDVLVTIRRAL